jgi:hypothetical protein
MDIYKKYQLKKRSNETKCSYSGSSFKSCEFTLLDLEVPSVTASLLQTTTRGSESTHCAFGFVYDQSY